MGWFASCFDGLDDPRTGNARRHNLLDILTIALVGMICGAESCTDFADFGLDRETLFSEFLELPRGLSSHDTFSRVFRLLDPAAFSQCFGRFLAGLGVAGAGVIAIDGKTLRRSFDKAAGTSPLHVVTAFASDQRLVLAQAATQGKDNEIVTARTVLEMFDLKGALVTAEAMHCNAKTAQLITGRGGDYLIALKKNRPAMFRDVEAFFVDPPVSLRCTRPSTAITAGSRQGGTGSMMASVGLCPPAASPTKRRWLG